MNLKQFESLCQCPCGSQKSYHECCFPYHCGKKSPLTALDLMKSRFSGYAKHQIDYIIKTTHPLHKDSQIPLKQRKASIKFFCEATQFINLQIIDNKELSETKAEVTFKATLMQNGHDVSFTETSQFEKIDGLWLYLSGILKDL